MTLCILDTAPHAAPDAARVAALADFIVIPCRPTAFDLAAAGAAVEIVRAASAEAAFVLSACPFRAPEIGETRIVLSSFGLPIAPTEITDRRAFARAVATGRAVTEFDSPSKAASEYVPYGNGSKGRCIMGSKPTGLAAFTQRTAPTRSEELKASPGTARKRGRGETVALTVRLSRSDWERLHQLAVPEGTSIQQLAVSGLSTIFATKGLPGLKS